MSKIYCYDIEVFPNYASFIFIDVEEYLNLYKEIRDAKTGELLVSEDERIRRTLEIAHKLFEISSIDDYEVCDILSLLSFVSDIDYLAGFNILDYDNVLLNMLHIDIHNFKSIKDINKKLYNLSKKLVETDFEILRNDEKVKLYRFYNGGYTSIDVQKIPALNKIFKSLKQTLINISWFSINDFELPPIDEVKEGHFYKNTTPEFYKYIKVWDRYLIKEHLSELIRYNANDVYGTCELFAFLKENIMLRFNITEKYNINVLSSSDSDIGNRFISKYYADYSGLDYKDFKDLRTHRTRMSIGKIISPLVKFKTKVFNKLLSDLLYTTVSSTNEINFSVAFNYVDFDIKSGGLHSKDIPGIYNNDDYYIKDFDFASWYPNLFKVLKAAPKHLNKEVFLYVVSIIIAERIQAKHDGNVTDAQVLKISINAAYGKTNFAYSFLFDTLVTLTITINGQLFLLMLVEQLALAGIPVISANTDGIISKIPKDKLDTYYKICNEFSEYVSIEGEYTDYVKYFRLDVNNYITVKHKKDGSLDVKRKGMLNQHLCTEDLKKGFNKPIVAKAVEEYFINNVPVSKTIKEERNIYLFCATQNMNSEFTPIYRKVKNNKIIEERLQKNIRFYVSNSGGMLLKFKDKKYTSVVSGHQVTIFNDYFSVNDFDDYDIKYSYYIGEANKLIAIIESGVKGNTKKVKSIQSNRFMNSMFSDETMEDLKITRKEEELELAEPNEIVKVPDTNLQDIDNEPDVAKDNTEARERQLRDEGFDTPNTRSNDGFHSSSFTGNLAIDPESHNSDYDTDEDDLPF